MKFQRLRLVGFKSFTDPVELVLEPGLTGVVGPNGCGKSNLVEALRFVMGESSYKALRGSGMDDVIFSGSGNRPARNSAEVTVVLDNSDRTAPAIFNTVDTLEVSRRIEREAGSIYRVNGREVRARDVQLLFADASTGAHSPALVRQGQIGELIAAKPVQRRALLEEAAGISGLHSRRHEAELRLRAAETNLERVDDIIAQVEAQLETLKRQARQASRYRALSGDIRRAEAALYHVRWVASRFAEKETEAAQGRAITVLAEANSVHLRAQAAHEQHAEALAPLRNADAAAAATVQRLVIAREQLEAEARRSDQRRTELRDRQVQIAADLARESTLTSESVEAVAALEAEQAELAAAAQAEAEIAASAAEAANAAREELALGERAAQDAAAALAQIRATRMQAQKAVAEAQARSGKLAQQREDIIRDAEAVAASLAADEAVGARRAALEAAQSRAAAAEAAADRAEKAAAAARTAVEADRPLLAELDGTLNRLQGEAETLARVLSAGGSGLWPSVVDTLKVSPGLETALGAALGDDLDASLDEAAPIYWSSANPHHDDPPLPEGTTQFTALVSGAPALARRLAQIGLVPAEDGARLSQHLRPGQRLVSREGALWRWDGLVAAADAPTAAAQRLAQRNRLAELDGEVAEIRRKRAAAQAEAEGRATLLARARGMESAARTEWREAQRAISAAQAGVEAAEKDLAKLTARQEALRDALQRVDASLEDARAEVSRAVSAETAIAPEGGAVAQAEERQRFVARLREASQTAAARLAELDAAGRLRTARQARVAQDLASWIRRRDSAEGQIETLRQRSAEIAAQIADLATSPDLFAAQRLALKGEIEAAEEQRKAASDSLSRTESTAREADRALRLAAEALAGARSELARIDERLKGAIAQRHQIERQIQEALGIPASRTAEVAGIRPEQALPQEAATEQRVERLKAERERLGGVNLRAEDEAKAVESNRDQMVADREDLIAAIAKLRTAISNLNREGRARLTEAFEKVNGHFRALFTSLFGGGTAELAFVESDDPLEAGLEIIARPPGKKPQTMTLLSGGEQALTAMSLIFAVFLTNPAPICVLDEVDAPLDDANVERFCTLLASMRERTDTRFVVITHNPITMSRVDRLFGVTMPERGVSQLVSVDLSIAESFREAV